MFGCFVRKKNRLDYRERIQYSFLMKAGFGRNATKVIAFYSIVLTILVCAAFSIMRTWGFFENTEDFAFKVFVTALAILVTSLLICLTNWVFLNADDSYGPKRTVGDGTPLSRALQKAKVDRESEVEG